jgi:hypothetical protein
MLVVLQENCWEFLAIVKKMAFFLELPVGQRAGPFPQQESAPGRTATKGSKSDQVHIFKSAEPVKKP